MKSKETFFNVFLSLFLVFTIGVTSYIGSKTQNKISLATPQSPAVRGVVGDLWADIEIGKRDFTEIAPREVVPYKLNSPGGTIVDRSVSPGRLYVWDSGNSRVLGVDLGQCYNSSGPCTAQVVVGQPSNSDYGACNQDSGFQNYPNRAPASASTLCGVWEGTHTTLEDKSFSSMFVDNQGNLYVPDARNHRILKYISPFTTDTIADEVWGQDDFVGNECNKTGDTLNRIYPNPSGSSLCFFTSTESGSGVSFDSQGNMWAADGGNNRVLRFPYDQTTGAISKTADLVLGQINFTSKSFGNALNKLNSPAALRFATSGELYVVDNGNSRILKFLPPFTNGMSGQVFTTVAGFSSGIEIDPGGRGVWTQEHSGSNTKYRLLDFQNQQLFQFITGSHGGGSFGIDTLGNILPSDYVYGQNVYKFTPAMPRDRCAINDGDVGACNLNPGCAYYYCSNQCWLRGTPNEIACISGQYSITKNLFSPPAGYNLSTNRRLEHPAWVGLAVTQNQLVIADGRILFWNDPASLVNGEPADGFVGAPDVATISGYEQMGSDRDGRIWVASPVRVTMYQSPLVSQMNPDRTLPTSVGVLGGGVVTLDNVRAVVPSDHSEFLWVSQPDKHRVMRIRNPLTAPVIDVILGQTNYANTYCNQDPTDPRNTDPWAGDLDNERLDTLCFPGKISIDKLGNLYISDHFIENAGNWRTLMFSASTFPTSNTTVLYAPLATKEFPRGANGQLHMNFELAFNSQNNMVVGNNPYSGRRFLDYYRNPNSVNPTNPSDPNYAMPDGQLNDFYGWPVAMTFDTQDNLYVYDANRGRVLIYNQPVFPVPPPTPTPTATPDPTPGPNYFSNLQSTLGYYLASFSFDYSGTAYLRFYIDVSTDPLMQTGVLQNFATSLNTRVSTNQPGAWPGYVCNSQIYWRARDYDGDVSPIQTGFVNCLPSPSPTPISYNYPPRFYGVAFPRGHINQPYQYNVVGFDQNVTDTLTMTISGLPQGLSQGACTESVSEGRKYLTCPIVGTPTLIGNSQVTLTISDNMGATGQITQQLSVRQ